jgi:hypothetical protein
MFPSVPLPTDNLYKFLSLLGLALVIASIAGLTAVYVSSLDTKTRLGLEIIELEAHPAPLPPGHQEKLGLKKRIFEITKNNERDAMLFLSLPLIVGSLLLVFGGKKWSVVQARDDQIGQLHLRKLTAEVAGLEAELRAGERV